MCYLQVHAHAQKDIPVYRQLDCLNKVHGAVHLIKREIGEIDNHHSLIIADV